MDNCSSSSNNNLHIVILSSPEAGHIIPVLLLAHRLADQHGVRSTVLLATNGESSPESTLVSPPRKRELVEVISLPPVDTSNLVGPSTKVVTQMCLMMREAVPLVRSAISAMDRCPDAIIVVHFGTESLRIAAEFGMRKYVYCTSTAWFLALSVYCPILDEEIQGQYVDEPGHLKIPGCKPVRPEDVVDMMLDRNDQQYREYLRIGKEITLCDGILVNSSEDLEAKTLQAFRENEAMKSALKSPVYPIGPLTRPVEPTGLKRELMDWLDKQPNQSVLFVSFGSGGVLSAEQTTELAWGLELSRQRFVWVIRPPKKGHVNDSFFPVSNDGPEDDYFPEGFLNRTESIGILVPSWGRPVEILAHKAVGGFLSHCGWNSTLESITSGVPMVAWPLYAEQRLNATMLVEELGVALRPESLPTKILVGREEIQKMVRTLLEHKDGQAIRDRARELKTSATNCLKEGGSSHASMCKFLSDIEAKCHA
ncbi:anthocyanidin 3-O-glucosyltransferase 5-like [Dorcoceras hygrometricum]|uniref:Anthocyanidin 3-O-glucosyltransferase 5-like n=1 Tax=Dorcoceras hygrometricum TaxID=472368 RepID=A0A2Z7DCW1_9LAMI|nr:anthocyanidin 3-O-glucosyltransferase 5-like [Dorcoceras hygrometricum]